MQFRMLRIQAVLTEMRWVTNVVSAVCPLFGQSGCCKPPTECGFTFDNATTWVGSSSGTTNTDCRAWSNTQAQLCFDCNACRAGVLQNVKSNWRRVAVVNIIVLVFIIFVYSCGCCAMKSTRRERAEYKYRYGQAKV